MPGPDWFGQTWFLASAGIAGIIFQPGRSDRKFQPQKKCEGFTSQAKIYYVMVPASKIQHVERLSYGAAPVGALALDDNIAYTLFIIRTNFIRTPRLRFAQQLRTS